MPAFCLLLSLLLLVPDDNCVLRSLLLTLSRDRNSNYKSKISRSCRPICALSLRTPKALRATHSNNRVAWNSCMVLASVCRVHERRSLSALCLTFVAVVMDFYLDVCKLKGISSRQKQPLLQAALQNYSQAALLSVFTQTVT